MAGTASDRLSAGRGWSSRSRRHGGGGGGGGPRGTRTTTAAPLVVPAFGRISVLGTNPISVAVPAGREGPFILDMATSVVPRGSIEVYDRQGKRMPLGWAVDAAGHATEDPQTVLESLARRLGGGILPLGGGGEGV